MPLSTHSGRLVVRPKLGGEVERSGPIISLKIDVTASFNELLRDGLVPLTGREVERSGPILVLIIDVTARSKEPLRDGRIPSTGCVMERRAPILFQCIPDDLASQE